MIGRDSKPPVFSMDSDTIRMRVSDGETGMLSGITASDDADGDVTDSILIEGISPFTDDGYRVVNYAVSDSAGNVSHTSRKLYYTDYTSPRIVMNAPLSFPLNASDLLAGIKAEDCVDGDISSDITINSKIPVVSSNVGCYEVCLEVCNSAGDWSRINATLEIYDSSEKAVKPQIGLSDYLVYVDQGAEFNEMDYVRSITIQGNEYTPVKGKGAYGTEKEGKTIGLVTTMGALHEGHASLIKAARKENDFVIATVFVNPTQFGPTEDYAAYPRTLEADCKTAEAAGADLLFAPSPEEMYPHKDMTWVEVTGPITKVLCGRTRPIHFRGVATVCTKFFNLTECDRAYYGLKDAQQTQVLQRMVEDLFMNVQLRLMPIVREADGLAKRNIDDAVIQNR